MTTAIRSRCGCRASRSAWSRATRALIKQVFALSPDHYEQRTASFPLNIGERSLLFPDGEEHRRNRQVMMPLPHGERLRGYVASMREVTARAVSRFTVGSVQPLHALFQEITLEPRCCGAG